MLVVYGRVYMNPMIYELSMKIIHENHPSLLINWESFPTFQAI